MTAAAAINLIAFSFDANAAQDTCTEQGGTADCVGPDVGPYTYQISSPVSSAIQGTEEAPIVSAFEEQIRNQFYACTLNVANNLPPWRPIPAGMGTDSSGSYSDALFSAIGQYWSVSWYLSTENNATRIPLVYTGTNPTTGSPGTPACSHNFGPFAAYVARWRDVLCPASYLANNETQPFGAYCFRAGDTLDPPKNLGQQCPVARDPTNQSPLIGNPTNPATGNKFCAANHLMRARMMV